MVGRLSQNRARLAAWEAPFLPAKPRDRHVAVLGSILVLGAALWGCASRPRAVDDCTAGHQSGCMEILLSDQALARRMVQSESSGAVDQLLQAAQEVSDEGFRTELVSSAVKRFPDRADLHLQFATLLTGRLPPDYDGAVAQFTVALRSPATRRAAQLGLAEVLLQVGRFTEAERNARSALDAGAGPTRARVLLGEALSRQRRYREAVVPLQLAVADQTDTVLSLRARLALADALFWCGDAERAAVLLAHRGTGARIDHEEACAQATLLDWLGRADAAAQVCRDTGFRCSCQTPGSPTVSGTNPSPMSAAERLVIRAVVTATWTTAPSNASVVVFPETSLPVLTRPPLERALLLRSYRDQVAENLGAPALEAFEDAVERNRLSQRIGLAPIPGVSVRTLSRANPSPVPAASLSASRAIVRLARPGFTQDGSRALVMAFSFERIWEASLRFILMRRQGAEWTVQSQFTLQP